MTQSCRLWFDSSLLSVLSFYKTGQDQSERGSESSPDAPPMPRASPFGWHSLALIGPGRPDAPQASQGEPLAGCCHMTSERKHSAPAVCGPCPLL